MNKPHSSSKRDQPIVKTIKYHSFAETASKPMSLFHAKRFAFAILFSLGQAYMHCSKRAAPLHHAKATRLSNRLEITMKLFTRLFARREINLTTALERQRLAKTMPGQTGAVAAARLGFIA
ncbi:hypothetical protein ACFWXH_11055 [Mesorhizobium sp. NPDC059054]|uniref:hypothetical protein n=1 Tax=Mesorhizobium sp. NPDC059054 TaxID=3346711 RepID=UPI0036C2F838